ncbi:MAG: hypothetical protein WCP06_05370 [Verrucomicrobiota bacterium]
MAEQSAANRKSELIAELERSRRELAGNIRGVRHDVDVTSHFRHAFAQRKTVWIAGAAVIGWLLARLPGRKARVARPGKELEKRKESQRSAFLFTLLNLAITVAKPALTALASKKITQFATGERKEGRARRYSGRW